MKEFLLLMHSDAQDPQVAESAERWERYLGLLRSSGGFEGGSSVGPGTLFRIGHAPVAMQDGASGFLRVKAVSLDAASALLSGNPVFAAGGTVEIRELLKD